MNTSNRYAPPGAPVGDPISATSDGTLIENGRTVGVGNGFKWVGDAWRLYKQQPLQWILILVGYIVAVIVVSLVPILGSLAVNLLNPVVLGGIQYAADQQRRTGRVEFSHAMAGFGPKFMPLFI